MIVPGKHGLALITLIALVFLPCLPSQAAPSASRPNIFFIMADDFDCFGSTFHQPPNLDKRAMRFTQTYAANPLSPNRSSVLTGLWPARADITALRETSPLLTPAFINFPPASYAASGCCPGPQQYKPWG